MEIEKLKKINSSKLNKNPQARKNQLRQNESEGGELVQIIDPDEIYANEYAQAKDKVQQMVNEGKIVDYEMFKMNVGYSQVNDNSFTRVFDGLSTTIEDQSLIVEYLVSQGYLLKNIRITQHKIHSFIRLDYLQSQTISHLQLIQSCWNVAKSFDLARDYQGSFQYYDRDSITDFQIDIDFDDERFDDDDDDDDDDKVIYFKNQGRNNSNSCLIFTGKNQKLKLEFTVVKIYCKTQKVLQTNGKYQQKVQNGMNLLFGNHTDFTQMSEINKYKAISRIEVSTHRLNYKKFKSKSEFQLSVDLANQIMDIVSQMELFTDNRYDMTVVDIIKEYFINMTALCSRQQFLFTDNYFIWIRSYNSATEQISGVWLNCTLSYYQKKQLSQYLSYCNFDITRLYLDNSYYMEENIIKEEKQKIHIPCCTWKGITFSKNSSYAQSNLFKISQKALAEQNFMTFGNLQGIFQQCIQENILQSDYQIPYRNYNYQEALQYWGKITEIKIDIKPAKFGVNLILKDSALEQVSYQLFGSQINQILNKNKNTIQRQQKLQYLINDISQKMIVIKTQKSKWTLEQFTDQLFQIMQKSNCQQDGKAISTHGVYNNYNLDRNYNLNLQQMKTLLRRMAMIKQRNVESFTVSEGYLENNIILQNVQGFKFTKNHRGSDYLWLYTQNQKQQQQLRAYKLQMVHNNDNFQFIQNIESTLKQLSYMIFKPYQGVFSQSIYQKIFQINQNGTLKIKSQFGLKKGSQNNKIAQQLLDLENEEQIKEHNSQENIDITITPNNPFKVKEQRIKHDDFIEYLHQGVTTQNNQDSNSCRSSASRQIDEEQEEEFIFEDIECSKETNSQTLVQQPSQDELIMQNDDENVITITEDAKNVYESIRQQLCGQSNKKASISFGDMNVQIHTHTVLFQRIGFSQQKYYMKIIYPQAQWKELVLKIQILELQYKVPTILQNVRIQIQENDIYMNNQKIASIII